MAKEHNWTHRSMSRTGEFTYEKVAWNHVKAQRLWIERFGKETPQDFWTFGRLIYNHLDASKLLAALTNYACETVNFMEPTFKELTFFRNVRCLQNLFDKAEARHHKAIVKLVLFEASLP